MSTIPNIDELRRRHEEDKPHECWNVICPHCMHIFNLRALGKTGRPHPQMQALMMPLLEECKRRVPCVFGDMGE